MQSEYIHRNIKPQHTKKKEDKKNKPALNRGKGDKSCIPIKWYYAYYLYVPSYVIMRKSARRVGVPAERCFQRVVIASV